MKNQQPILIKLSFVHGLREIVAQEMAKYPELGENLRVVERDVDSAYFDFIPASGEIDDTDESSTTKDSSTIVESFLQILKVLMKLKSITNLYLVQKGEKLHPIHLNNHKSILGTMIELVIHANEIKTFKTFKLRCAGSDSPEAISIQKYISDTFKLTASEDTDLDTYIHRPGELWEVGVRVTSRPLSVRDYRVENIKGGMNPTVAYAVNTFALGEIKSDTKDCDITDTKIKGVDIEDTGVTFSYLNICSGSATLLIEAAIEVSSVYEMNNIGGKTDIDRKSKTVESSIKLLGFDIENKTNSLAIQNIKKAGFIRSIQIKTADLLDKPDFGMFDAIVSDLPFGMQISKGADLNKLYKVFVEYAGSKLKQDGVLVVYTTETDTFERALRGTNFNIQKSLSLQITTAVNSHIEPKIFVCKFK